MAKVYGLYNRTREERYYGITTRQSVERMKDASRQANALKHWNFDEDDITVTTVARGLSHEMAVARVHELELHKSPLGWKTIQTGNL